MYAQLVKITNNDSLLNTNTFLKNIIRCTYENMFPC